MGKKKRNKKLFNGVGGLEAFTTEVAQLQPRIRLTFCFHADLRGTNPVKGE